MSTKKRKFKNKHEYFMQLAFYQASKILGNTGENPAVGCLLVKNNNIINLSHTNINGRPHAERLLLSKKKINYKNSILYSTLEPCSHYGKTPPCTNIIAKKKIKSVFFSKFDPDYRSYNKASKILKRKKIKIFTNICKKIGNNFYKDFHIKKKSHGIFITSKLATSRDYFTVLKNKKWITNIDSRARVHLLRANHDAILTTANTVIKDNPMLDCRIEGLQKFSPFRFVLDKNLKISINSKILRFPKKNKTILMYNKSDKKKLLSLKKNKIQTVKINLKNGHLDFNQVIGFIKKKKLSRLFIESGINFNNFLLKNNYINVFYHFFSNDLIHKKGSNSAKLFINRINKIKKSKRKIKVNLFKNSLMEYLIK